MKSDIINKFFIEQEVKDVGFFSLKQNDGLIITLSNGYYMKLFWFWRIVKDNKVYATIDDRYFKYHKSKVEHEVPTLKDSSLYKKLWELKKYLPNIKAEQIIIDNVCDLYIELNNHIRIENKVIRRIDKSLAYAFYSSDHDLLLECRYNKSSGFYIIKNDKIALDIID